MDMAEAAMDSLLNCRLSVVRKLQQELHTGHIERKHIFLNMQYISGSAVV